jgi:hypothetical protein
MGLAWRIYLVMVQPQKVRDVPPIEIRDPLDAIGILNAGDEPFFTALVRVGPVGGRLLGLKLA